MRQEEAPQQPSLQQRLAAVGAELERQQVDARVAQQSPQQRLAAVRAGLVQQRRQLRAVAIKLRRMRRELDAGGAVVV